MLTLRQLTEQYGEYLDALTSWAHDYLDIRFSSQVGYNMAVDMVSLYHSRDGWAPSLITAEHIAIRYPQS